MSNILTFDDLTTNNKALKKFVQAFTRAGAPVATIDTDGKPKRTTGVTYRELVLTFVDNQKAVFLIKQGGSIFQVKINGAVVPIKNQDDQVKAVGEIVQILDAGRAKFQTKLARQKVVMPSGLKTAAPRLEVKLQEASTKLAQDISAAQARVAALRAELGDPVLDSVVHEDPNDGTEFNLELALAQAKAIIAGELMDDTHAVTNLKISLECVETNYPIHLAEGKLDQAELEKAAAVSFREAIAILEQKQAA